MALNQDIARLAAEFGDAWDVRTTAIAGIRIDTAEQLAGFRAERTDMAEEQDERLKAEVAAMKSDVADFMDDLAAGSAARSEDVAATLDDHTTARAEMGREQDERLKAYVAAVKKDMAAMLSDLDEAHAAMAEEQRAKLSEDHERLVADGAAEREERQDDVAGRKAGWAKVTAAMDKRRVRAAAAKGRKRRPAAAKPVEKAPEPAPVRETTPVREPEPVAAVSAPEPRPEPRPEPVVVAPPKPEPVVAPPKPVRDDLTRIRGIGEGMQTRLNALGISSFAQLVAADVPKLREGLGDVGRMARIDDWKEQAEGLL